MFLETASFDASVMSQVVSLVKTALGFLTEFPCNLFLYGGIASMGFQLFSHAKNSVRM